MRETEAAQAVPHAQVVRVVEAKIRIMIITLIETIRIIVTRGVINNFANIKFLCWDCFYSQLVWVSLLS